MTPNDSENITEIRNEDPHEHSKMFGVLVAGLVLALAGDVYLAVRSSNLNDQIAKLQGTTQAQISKLGEATTTLLQQRLESINSEVKDAQDAAGAALKQARSEAQRQGAQIARRLDEQQKQVGDELTQLKDETTTATSKINEVSTDVSGVKTDVSGVRTDVTAVKADVASTQSQLEKDGADLKRVMGDMGVMSGLIATNGKDLEALRELGDRNYVEFTLSKGQLTKKVGDITLTLKKADPKRNRFSIEIAADDKRIEKKDKTINEPVQLYVSGNRQPDEIVVNQVKKDEVVGYVAMPKMKMARR